MTLNGTAYGAWEQNTVVLLPDRSLNLRYSDLGSLREKLNDVLQK